MTNTRKQQFSDRIAALVREFGDSKIKFQAARDELERIFDRRWVSALEDAIEEPREACQSCRLDEAVSNMSDGLCYVCSRADRHPAME